LDAANPNKADTLACNKRSQDNWNGLQDYWDENSTNRDLAEQGIRGDISAKSDAHFSTDLPLTSAASLFVK